jgi:hypothetical protein
VSGNFGYFNVLTTALCVPLMFDAHARAPSPALGGNDASALVIGARVVCFGVYLLLCLLQLPVRRQRE